MKEIEGQNPRKGMNRNSHPSEVQEGEYTFAKNINIQNEQTGGQMMVQNESSNTLCSKFKEGYIVLKAKYDRVRELTYFFLLNEDTGCSEIGKIDVNKNIKPNQAVSKNCGCDVEVVLEEGLETIEEILPSCEYETIISDCCEGIYKRGEGCLNFSKTKPVKDVIIRHSTWGDELYFTDDLNPQRYLRLDYLEEYKVDKDDCTGEETNYCLDCEKLRLFTKHEFPCLEPDVIQSGGNLPAGVYETFIFFCDKREEILTSAVASTNPIAIFDNNKKIVSQNNLDYATDKAYSLDVDFKDKNYEYYKVVIAYSSGINPAPQYYDYGVYTTGQEKVVISTLPNTKNTVTEYDILLQKPTYKTAKGMEEVNGYLFQHGLKQQREINLQPVVNLMGTFAKWMTYTAKEDLFSKGINTSKYKGRMRDEIYPEALQFELKGGYKTARFPLISRPLKASTGEGDPYEGNTNYESINKYAPKCSETDRKYKWQYENTATEDTKDCSEGEGTETVEYTEEITCETDEYVVQEGSLEEEEGSIIEWVNNNKDKILNNPSEYPELNQALTNDFGTCSPEYEGDCEEPILIEENIKAVSVEKEGYGQKPLPCETYEKTTAPSSCTPLLKEEGTLENPGGVVNPPEHFTEVEDAILPSANVYKKEPIDNTTCSTAKMAEQFAGGQEVGGSHLVDMVEQGGNSSLKTDKSVSCTNDNFTNNIHSNVAWFKADFLLEDYITIEITDITCNAPDDNTDNTVRVSFWDGCIGEEIEELCRFIDLTDVNCEDRFITLNKEDFPSEEVKIAVDSPMHKMLDVKFTITELGQGSIEIEGNTYPVTGNNLQEIVQNFITANQTAIEAEGMYVEATTNGEAFIIRMNQEQYESIIIQDPTESGLVITHTIEEEYYRLSPPCGCFSVVKRKSNTEPMRYYEGLKFRKFYKYEFNCIKTIPVIYGACDAVPYKQGEFAYTESVFRYPCNEELYDSSTLKIEPEDIPLSIRSKFESVFTNGVVSNEYLLNNETNFVDKPIRHFKYPDNRVAPYMYEGSSNKIGKDQDATIQPLGFHLSNEVINAFLDVAVKNGLLTQEEREDIVSYEVFRGDRRTQRSVVARGIASNMLAYSNTESKLVLYPNYPFNTRNKDEINQKGTPAANKLTFLSPDTLFNKPTLPTEALIEGYLTGGVTTTFAPMQDHPTQVLLGRKAIQLAGALAAAEIGAEITMMIAEKGFELFDVGGGTYLTAAYFVAKGLLIAALILAIRDLVVKAGRIRFEWIQTFEGIGQGYNFAYIGLGECRYNNFITNTVDNSYLRGLNVSTYLNPGDITVRDQKGENTYRVNNYNREDSVMLGMGDKDIVYPSGYNNYENSMAQIKYSEAGEFSKTVYNGKPMRSVTPFVTLKNYLPGQWGQIESIPWLPTNTCNRLNEDNACKAVFGGDVFISRMSVKKKFPIFRKTAHNLPPNTPYKYSRYLNIKMFDWNNFYMNDIGFLDYKTDNDTDSIADFIFPQNKSRYTLFTDPGPETNLGSSNDINEFYVTDKYKFLVEYFSIPSFLVESEINCNYRYGTEGTETPMSGDFSPNVANNIDWVQRSNVPMHTREKFLYNWVYSKANYKKTATTLPQDFSREESDKKEDLENRVIYSMKDDSTESLRAPWRHYKANDYHTFSKGNGDLISINGLESKQVLFRFTDGYDILGAIDPIRDRLTKEQEALGIGNIFNERAVNFNKTELGHAGTQNKTFLSTPFGHYWVDAKRGKVFELKPNAEGMKEISQTMDKWFLDQLPFKILEHVPDANIDNHYNGVGISMGYDSVYKRIFITKKDYIPNTEGVKYDKEVGYYIGEDETTTSCPNGYTYDSVNNVCYKEEEVEREFQGTPLVIEEKGGEPHGWGSPTLFSDYNLDGTANVDTNSPTGYTYERLQEDWWRGNGVVNQRYVNILAKWSDSFEANKWYGGTKIIDVPQTKTYYVGLAADNEFRFSVDGTVIVKSDPVTIGQQQGSSTSSTFVRLHIYPIEIQKGCREITIEGLNDKTNTPGLFAAVIMDNTKNEIINATSQSEINEIFSTEDMTEFYETGVTKECPPGSTPQGEDLCSKCLKRVEVDPIEDVTENKTPVDIKDNEVSWTIAYSPLTESWISYYDFTPNYYIGYNQYFQTGLNELGSKRHGVWSHYPYISSYQVFYGDLYPTVIEYVKKTKGLKGIIEDVRFWLDVRKYTNKYDFSDIYGKGFNKAYVYNDFQNTGLLNLNFQDKNDRRQIFNYPKHNVDSTDILQSEIEGQWSFNTIYNRVKNERSGLPIWLNDKVNIDKVINTPIMNYSAKRKDRIRGDYFLIRLIQDEDSRFKMFFKSASEKINYYR